MNFFKYIAMLKSLRLKLIILLYLFQIILFADKGDIETVTLQLQWKHQFQFAGYYIAKEKGFYKNEGLNVEIIEFDNSIDTVKTVMSTKATYATGRPSLIIDKSNNIDVVLLCAIFQSSPHILLTTKKSGIKTIKDFKNKRLMSTGDAKNDAALISMMFSKKVELSNLILQKPSFNVSDLINNKTDLMSSYISNEPFKLKKLGGEPVIFDPKDYGFDFYSDILFTSSDEIKNHSNRAKRFNNASLKGWKYAFDNIDETVNLILKKYNTQNKTKEALIYEANKLKELAYYKTDEIGTIKQEKIEKIYDVYNLMGLVENKINFDSLIFRDKKSTLELTYDEEQYIKKNKIIRMCNNQKYEPVEFAYNNNQNDMRGIAIDTLKLIENQLDIKFINIPTKNWKESQQFLKEKKCDILPAAVKNTKRLNYANFTKSYLNLPLVILTHKDKGFISDFESLTDKKMSRREGSALINILEEKYPKLKIIKTKSMHESLQYVAEKKADFTIGTVPNISTLISKYLIDDIHIAGYTDMVYRFSIQVRDDDILLLNILNKALNSIEEQQHKKIYKKWVNPIIKEQITDYKLIWQVIIGFSIFVVVAIFYMFKIKKLKDSLSKSYQNLQKLIDTQDNIVILSDGNNISFANKSFFEFFGYKSLEQSHSICDKFIENNQFFHMGKLKENENWIEHLLQLPHSKRVVGILRHDFSIQAFSLSINKYDDDQYIISFANITQTILCNIELQDKTIKDKLTDAYNREYFEQNYQQIIKETTQSGLQMALAFLDIDHFKMVNDTYGHSIGDEVLKHFVKIVNKFSRDNDILIRWGGEEFILLLRVKSDDGLKKALEHLRQVIEDTLFPKIGQKTCSIGGTIYINNEDIEDTIKRADIGVYKAKENGRNKVVIV
jgi:polar amino acid transport system substrate-binding protein